MATKKKVDEKRIWPKVVKGTHLTVTTYEDGTTKLEWDDEALLNEIREATNSVKTDKPKKRKTKEKL